MSSAVRRVPLLLACGGSFLAFLDATITNLAVPALAHDFGVVDLASLSWVITLYTVLFAALLAPAGRAADVLGRRRLFAAGVTAFTAASLLAAVAPAFDVLLMARAAQGVGAAALLPASLAFVLADTPAARRARAIGLWSAAASVGAAVGPALGGALVDAAGWRSLFALNVPLGALLACLTLRVPAGRSVRGRMPDFVGTMLLAGGVALLVLGVTEGRGWGWTGGRTLACLLGAAVVIALALVRSARHTVPAIEVGLWRGGTYKCANVVSVLFGVALYATLLVGVLFLSGVWHYSELRAGLAMTPGAVASAAVGIVVGRASRRPSARALTVTGALVLTATSTMLALGLSGEPRFLAIWLPANILGGAGMGAVSVGVSSAAALSVAPRSFAAATGLNVAARQVGGALGVAAVPLLLAGHVAGAGDAPFEHAYLLIGASCLVAALVGTRLVVTPPAPEPGRREAATTDTNLAREV